jgi:hypothetical protein
MGSASGDLVRQPALGTHGASPIDPRHLYQGATMADDRNDRNRNAQAGATGSDSESDLRDELQREQKEAQGGIGDVAEDRNLSGSSSWLTDPPQPKPDKQSGSSSEGRSRK